MNSKQRCLAAIRGEPVDRIPAFLLLMFFAADRHGIPYRTYATDGAALAAAQLRALEAFPIDAITACSDAYRVPADLGADIVYPEDKTPYARVPLVRGAADVSRLHVPDPLAAGSRMADRVAAVAAMARAAGDRALVLGWTEMPFAEACSLCGVSAFMTLLIDDPVQAHAVLEVATEIEIAFGLAQLAAGAPMIGCGDAAASLISARMFREFALPYEQRVVDALHAAGGLVKLHICGNTTHLLPDMVRSGADLFNVDHLVPFEAACEVYGAADVCFKGNLDPVAEMMQATSEACAASARARIARAAGLRYMLSAGCEIPAATSDAVFRAFCEAPFAEAEAAEGEGPLAPTKAGPHVSRR